MQNNIKATANYQPPATSTTLIFNAVPPPPSDNTCFALVKRKAAMPSCTQLASLRGPELKRTQRNGLAQTITDCRAPVHCKPRYFHRSCSLQEAPNEARQSIFLLEVAKIRGMSPLGSANRRPQLEWSGLTRPGILITRFTVL